MPAPVHLRRQIREAVAALVGNLATTGTRVHQSRMRPKKGTGLPCLLVHSNDTEQVSAADADVMQQRELPIVIRGIAAGGDTLDDTLDQIAMEVETALAADPRLGGKATLSRLQSVDTDFDDTLADPVGEIQLTYLYTYFTQAGAPGVNA